MAKQPDWTIDEENYLRAHPERAERAAVAHHLGRSVAGVTNRLSLLGLIRSPGKGGRPSNYVAGLRGRPSSPPLLDATARLARPAWFADDDRRDLVTRMTAGR